jgi:hypothetical protein
MVLVRELLTCRTCGTEVPAVLWGIHQEAHVLERANTTEPDPRLLHLGLAIVFAAAAAITFLR